MKKDKDIIEQVQGLDNNSSSDLSNKKLSSLDLQDKDFTGSDCSGASFMMSNLAGCDFTNCNLTDTNFLNANLTHAIFEGAHRNKLQIINFASIISGGKSAYGFLCQKKDTKIAFITEGNMAEYEWKQGKATIMGRMIYQLLVTE